MRRRRPSQDHAGSSRHGWAVGRRRGKVAATVVRERELLTDRARTLFEEHLLGELGDRLRARRQEIAELVSSMNTLLEQVKTSQGIRVRLDWELREDAGSDVRDAVALLGRAPGSRTVDERSRLRQALSAHIEVQRGRSPSAATRSTWRRRWTTGGGRSSGCGSRGRRRRGGRR